MRYTIYVLRHNISVFQNPCKTSAFLKMGEIWSTIFRGQFQNAMQRKIEVVRRRKIKSEYDSKSGQRTNAIFDRRCRSLQI